LNASVYNDIADRENVDPLASLNGKDTDDPFRMKSVSPEEEEESSFETVIHYNSKPKAEWAQSTPATPRTRKSSARRKSTKRKSTAKSGLYPELSVYPDLSGVVSTVPTTSSEEFGKIANGILEEMNVRVACMSSIMQD